MYIPKILVICERSDTASIWGYILRQHGLTALLETSIATATSHCSVNVPDLVVIDIDSRIQDRVNLYRNFRLVCVAPIVLLLPAYDEIHILEAYAAGIDDVVLKPISPVVLLAKILAWSRRSATVSINVPAIAGAGIYTLDPVHRSLLTPAKTEFRLTNLEFRLLHLLMSRPSHIFRIEEIIETIWAAFGEGDQVLLKNVVYRLRRKIEPDPSHPILLLTWPGGYSFQG